MSFKETTFYLVEKFLDYFGAIDFRSNMSFFTLSTKDMVKYFARFPGGNFLFMSTVIKKRKRYPSNIS